MSEKVNYKKVTLTGMIWKFLEQVATKLIAFVVSVVLARLLFPEDYGVIALTSIFITICDIFVSSGFATSLIQKKDTDELDYSSVFYTSLVVALILYALLFFSAPMIAEWLETPVLCDVLRVLGIRIPIAAFGSVQQAYATKNYMFKKFFIATLAGTTVSGVVGIIMAYSGFGIWALVAHDLISICINKITLFFVTKWHPRLCYSWKRTKSLFSYGWKVLAASLFATICAELNTLLIGKKYTTEDLAYTNKGSAMPKLIGQFAVSPIQFVLMPVLSSKQGEKNMVHTITSCVTACAYIVFPLMCGLAIVSPTLVPLLYTDKWNGCIIFMQLMCIYYAVEPLITINVILIQANGKSTLYLITGMIARIVGLIGLFIAVNFGVFWIIFTQVLTLLVNFIIVAIPNGKLYGYSFFRQIKDLVPYFLLTAVMGISIYFMNYLPINPYVILVLQVISGVVLYVLLSLIFKIPAFTYLWNTVMSLLGKNKKTGEQQNTEAQEISEMIQSEEGQ